MQREITPIWEDQFASVGGYFNSQSVTTFKDVGRKVEYLNLNLCTMFI